MNNGNNAQHLKLKNGTLVLGLINGLAYIAVLLGLRNTNIYGEGINRANAMATEVVFAGILNFTP
jgi:hypothetical protein